VRSLPDDGAYKLLQLEDPLRAAQLSPNDRQRIARALEVKRSTGVTLADWQVAKAGGIGEHIDLHPLVLLPDRTWLYQRCDLRFEAMLQAGAVAEVDALLARGLDPDLPVMRAYPRSHDNRRTAGHPQLCQTPVHLVPAAGAG